jgi:hypothetical protein
MTEMNQKVKLNNIEQNTMNRQFIIELLKQCGINATVIVNFADSHKREE